MTEVMGFLIAVGAVMIFVVWNQSKRRKQQADERQEIEETSSKLKRELEKTANNVISRMESQVSDLEELMDESEKNRTVLEGRVAELKKLLKRSEGQSTEIRDLLVKLEEAGDTVEELQRRLEATEKKITMAMQPQMPMQMQMPMPMQNSMMMNPTMMTPMTQPMMTPPIMTTPLPNVPSPISPPPILNSRTTSTVTPKPIESKPIESKTAEVKTSEVKQPVKRDKAEIKKELEKFSTEGEKAEPKDFAKVLEKSMGESKVESKVPVRPRVPDRRSIVLHSTGSSRATIIEKNEPVKISTKRTVSEPVKKDSETAKEVSMNARIKNMLLEGMTVEEIARETGLGRGAIELVQQMTRRQLERK